MESLSGKWKYKEEYGYGEAEGELFIEQQGDRLSGRIVFTDKVEDSEAYMIQEFVSGTLEDRKVKLDAKEFDVIHSEHPVDYELDNWFGILVDERTIIGVSVDDQGVEGHFMFEKR